MSYHGSHRVGEFKIMMDTIENEPDLVADIFSRMGFIPVRAELLWGEGVFVYQGISKLFDDVDAGQAVPFYRIEIKMNEEGLAGVSVIKEQKSNVVMMNEKLYSGQQLRDLSERVNNS